MSFFAKKKNQSAVSEPDERAQLTDHLVAALWQRKDDNGAMRVSWSVDRHNKAAPESPYRTLRPRDLLEMPDFVRQLASALAQSESLPLELRKRLGNLAAVMSQVAEMTREAIPNGKDDSLLEGSRVLAG